jgi:hypothetical protein
MNRSSWSRTVELRLKHPGRVVTLCKHGGTPGAPSLPRCARGFLTATQADPELTAIGSKGRKLLVIRPARPHQHHPIAITRELASEDDGGGMEVAKKVHLRGFYGGSSAWHRPACGSPEGMHPCLTDDRDAVTCRVCLAHFGEALFERRVQARRSAGRSGFRSATGAKPRATRPGGSHDGLAAFGP